MSADISSVGILVPSCDKYSDLWPTLFAGFDLHWKDCALPIYVLSNHLRPDRAGVQVILVGEDKGWSDNLLRALEVIRHEYILLYIEDLVLSSRIDNHKICALIERCIEGHWEYLRFNPTPGPPSRCCSASDVGVIPPGDVYRSSTVMSLWKTSVLKEVLRPGESAWEFEIFGSVRTDKHKHWYACTAWHLPHHNLVVKGKLERKALHGIREMGIDIRTSRPVMNSFEQVLLYLKRFRSLLMTVVPRSARRAIRSLFAAS